ncbi:hypothetical protein SAMN02745161_2899 [Halodesulfovibrio marinisediminis DSM 17456]|uniref:Uncharacterized protein n=1 Tax=Halodesulfovibrio marinisediminis DSM 17456 TaxID=1121457 RepID=A0A1N6ISW6_9BACT|nr:hypothetical protein SAMN02745161_2899 [Halodesulfovibrio marinisediminis DSM 17456]
MSCSFLGGFGGFPMGHIFSIIALGVAVYFLAKILRNGGG